MITETDFNELDTPGFATETADIICFCPECRKETFNVTITDSGKGHDPEYGVIHWFSGDGVCSKCGYEAPYGDSSV